MSRLETPRVGSGPKEPQTGGTPCELIGYLISSYSSCNRPTAMVTVTDRTGRLLSLIPAAIGLLPWSLSQIVQADYCHLFPSISHNDLPHQSHQFPDKQQNNTLQKMSNRSLQCSDSASSNNLLIHGGVISHYDTACHVIIAAMPPIPSLSLLRTVLRALDFQSLMTSAQPEYL